MAPAGDGRHGLGPAEIIPSAIVAAKETLEVAQRADIGLVNLPVSQAAMPANRTGASYDAIASSATHSPHDRTSARPIAMCRSGRNDIGNWPPRHERVSDLRSPCRRDMSATLTLTSMPQLSS